jgi:hypothetical protein
VDERAESVCSHDNRVVTFGITMSEFTFAGGMEYFARGLADGGLC